MSTAVTSISVMIPSGTVITGYVNLKERRTEFSNLTCGPVMITREEASAMRDILNILHPESGEIRK